MIKKLFLFSLYTYIILVNYLTFCNAKISDKRLCSDPECSSILSYATTLLRYDPSEECMIRFPANVKVNVMSKGAGQRKDLWEIVYNGERGYAPARLIRETQILKKSAELLFEVPTECENVKKMEQVAVEQPKVVIPIVPASAAESFEMVDGTKIYNDEMPKVTDEVAQAGSVVETPNLSSVPALEEEVNKSSSPSDSEDDDYEGDEFSDEEEMVDDTEDEESEETVDRNDPGIDLQNDFHSNIASEEVVGDSIISENSSSEMENNITKNENLSLNSSVPEDLRTEPVKPDNVSSITPANLGESPKNEEIVVERLHTMVVTETPNEIPLPILDSQFVLEATTSSPFLESITEKILEETVPNSLDSSLKLEVENLINNQEETSDTPLVPSAEQINIMVEESTFTTQREIKKMPESVESEYPSELNSIRPEPIEEQPKEILDEESKTLPLSGVYEISEKSSESIPISPEPVGDDSQPIVQIIEALPSPPLGSASLVEQQIVNDIPVALPPQGVYETLEALAHINPVGPEPVQKQPIIDYVYPPPPSAASVHDETPPGIKTTEPELINNNNKIEESGQKFIKDDGESILAQISESVEDQSITEIPGTNSPSSPEIPPPVIEAPEIVLPQENPTTPLKLYTEPENPGLFATIYAKVFGSGSDIAIVEDQKKIPLDEELDRILYPEKFLNTQEPSSQMAGQDTNAVHQMDAAEEYCENVSPNSCPRSLPTSYPPLKQSIASHFHSAHKDAPENCTGSNSKGIDYEEYVKVFLDGIIKMRDFIIYLSITALTILSFMFGYYCINKCRKESPLINNLNLLERTLMVSKKENVLLQGELDDIRQKLASIEDNSFGSNEMVIALKTQLEDSENHKIDYQLQVSALEKELESATEAGLELNRMVAELLNNQSGSESIISSVEELQKQLNEQQETILSINATLAEKSRENSELQVFLNEQKKQFDDDFSVLQSLNEHLTETNTELNTKISEMTETLEVTVNAALKSKSDEIVKVTKELGNLTKWYEDSQRKLAKAESRCQVLDEYLKNAKNEATDTKEVYDFLQLKSEALAATKEKEQFRERLEGQTDARKLLEDHLKVVSEEISMLKKEYNVAEKEKVEAQTRLEVLSGYFKEKETQLQKELSIKEAMWLQQQGEKTSTIERVQSMQDEIQNLKSQNDALRAEIEAQASAHKTQIATLDSRAHEEWLSAKQAKRKLEEVRSEATGLRRKLTAYGEAGGVDATGIVNGIDGNLNAPSPIMMVGDSNPGASLLGVLPPPPFMPPPFMGPPPPFMPPPFMPGEMRPPPLGRLMSPPPNRYSPSEDRDHYSPNRSPGRYSPDARYNYIDVLSPYETETDFSPPPSPPPRHGGYRDNRGYKAYSPPPQQLDNRNKKSKGGINSGSTDSLPRRRGGGGGGDNAGSNHQNGSNKV